MTTNGSQADLILTHLKPGRTITPIEALNRYGCFRLAARVLDLRQAGYPICTHTKQLPNGKHIAEYSL